MGIRFLCSSCGHKLNVKSFLAGKRGVCPQCGCGLDIPLESQISKQAPHAGANGGATAASATAPVVTVPPLDVVTDRESAAPQISVPTAAPREKVKKPPSRSAAAEEPTLPAIGAGSDSGPLSVPMKPAQPIQPAVPVQPAQPIQPEAAVASPVQAAPPDPIDEAPDAIWYVRPPTGGQYGPARGEIMRKWIGEGRVSADSLVWREGWNDWCSASDLFASLGAGVTPPVPAPAAPATFAGPSAPTSTASSLRPRRRNSTALAVTVVAVLGLMCVTLFVALILILVN